MRLSSSVLFSLCASLGATQEAPDLVTLLTSSAAANLSTLTTLVQSNEALLSVLGSSRNITILAPNNDAFNTLNQSGALQAAQSNPDLVPDLLSYHVLQGTTYASGFTETPIFAATFLNSTTATNVTGGQRVEGRLSGQDVLLASGLKQQARVVQANINFTGGVIHIIDRVLTVPENFSSTASAAGLSALTGALIKADLVSTLDGLKDVTIFAPSNAAFDAIGSALGSLTTEQFVSILGGHVINGTVAYSTSLSNTSIATLGGSNVNITASPNGVFVNSARVITPDILVANGVVHVIDSVLNPNATDSTPPAGTSAAVAFPGASSAPNGLTPAVPPASTTVTDLPPTATVSNVNPTGSAPASSTQGGGAEMLKTESWIGILALGLAAMAF